MTGQIHFCSVMYRFWPVKCIWWITLLGAHKPQMKNWKLLIKVEIQYLVILRPEVGESRCLFQCANCKQWLWLHVTRISYQSSAIHSDSINNNRTAGTLNLFHFQYDWILTGQHDRQDKSLTGQIHNQSGHCPLTGRYFEPSRREDPLQTYQRIMMMGINLWKKKCKEQTSGTFSWSSWVSSSLFFAIWIFLSQSLIKDWRCSIC